MVKRVEKVQFGITQMKHVVENQGGYSHPFNEGNAFEIYTPGRPYGKDGEKKNVAFSTDHGLFEVFFFSFSRVYIISFRC
jgi:hypothetical protein